MRAILATSGENRIVGTVDQRFWLGQRTARVAVSMYAEYWDSRPSRPQHTILFSMMEVDAWVAMSMFYVIWGYSAYKSQKLVETAICE